MNYNSKDADQAFPEGTYQATIKSFTKTDKEGKPMKSKKGEAMCRVGFDVYVGESTRSLQQYFTEKSTLWMYRELAKALNAYDDFKANTFTAGDYIGGNVELEVIIKASEQYGDQNQIKSFAASSVTSKRRATAGVAPTDDGDIPFTHGFTNWAN